MKTIRINLEVPEEYRERLKNLQTATGATTQAEVFRRAIGTMEALAQITQAGGKIKAVYPDGNSDTLIFLS